MTKLVHNSKKFLTGLLSTTGSKISMLPVATIEGVDLVRFLELDGGTRKGYTATDITYLVYEVLFKFLKQYIEDSVIWNPTFQALGYPVDLDLSGIRGLKTKTKKLESKLSFILGKALKMKKQPKILPAYIAEPPEKFAEYEHATEELGKKQRSISIQSKREPKEFVSSKQQRDRNVLWDPKFEANTKTDVRNYGEDEWVHSSRKAPKKQAAGYRRNWGTKGIPEYRTFGYLELTVLEKLRSREVIIRPEITTDLDVALGKLINWLFSEHIGENLPEGFITVDPHQEGQQTQTTIIEAKLTPTGSIEFASDSKETADKIGRFMQTKHPLMGFGFS